MPSTSTGRDVGVAPTDRTAVRRKPDRAHYEAETVHTILDEALYCHVGLVRDGIPVVIPTIHAATATGSTSTARPRPGCSATRVTITSCA